VVAVSNALTDTCWRVKIICRYRNAFVELPMIVIWLFQSEGSQPSRRKMADFVVSELRIRWIQKPWIFASYYYIYLYFYLYCTLLSYAAHLQCTTIGPASGGCVALTRRMKISSGLGLSGTPWSGHAVNWNWRTSQRSEKPLCNKSVSKWVSCICRCARYINKP